MSAVPALPGPFAIDVINAATRTITLRGEIDMATAPNLFAAAQTYLNKAPGDLIIDLAAVTFGDSSLVHEIADIEVDARQHGGQVMIINASARIKRLFLLCGRNKTLDVLKPSELRPSSEQLFKPPPLEHIQKSGSRRNRTLFNACFWLSAFDAPCAG